MPPPQFIYQLIGDFDNPYAGFYYDPIELIDAVLAQVDDPTPLSVSIRETNKLYAWGARDGEGSYLPKLPKRIPFNDFVLKFDK
jgi:hypothetical protein